MTEHEDTGRSGMVQFHEELLPLMKPIDSVQQHPENYNNGDVEAVVESIMTSGMYRPIYVQKSSGYIIAGNHTWMACKELGAEQIPMVVVDVNDTTARTIMVADNQTARLARPDNGQLLDLLHKIKEDTDDSLMGTGFKEYDLTVLENLAKIEHQTDEFGTWPTLCFQIPPHAKNAFTEMTQHAGGDRERFELLLRLAGWDGKK